MTEDEMLGWHHWLNGEKFEQALGDGKRQGNLACSSSWVRYGLTTEKQQQIIAGLPRCASGIKNHPANAGDVTDADLIPGLGKSLGGRQGKSLQHSCLENSMDRGALMGYSPLDCKELDMTEVT